jgi:hypothetical protein
MTGEHMDVGNYLGRPVSELLAATPFNQWVVARSTEEVLPRKEVWYEFEGHGVDDLAPQRGPSGRFNKGGPRCPAKKGQGHWNCQATRVKLRGGTTDEGVVPANAINNFNALFHVGENTIDTGW